MEIKDIKANRGSIEVTAEVVGKEEPRQFEKFGKAGKVCNAKLRDATGQITLTLWNDDVERVNVGDKVRLQNGWCSEFKGELQVSTGKFGKIEVLSGRAEVLTNDPEMLGKVIPGEDDESEEDVDVVEEEEFVE